MEVKKGYKITEIGVIPEDWEVVAIGNVATVTMGQSPAGTSYNRRENGTPLINGPTEFTKKFPIKIQWTTNPTKFCKTGDILLCVRGSSTGRMNISNDKYCIGRGVAAICANTGATQDLLVFHLESAVKIILSLTTGSTFPNIDGKTISTIRFPLPSPSEQTAIATVLSETDELIDSLERLLAKKRNVKQAAMQELLTGKRRLPGFEGTTSKKIKTVLGELPSDWGVVPFDDAFDFLSSATYSRSQLSESGEVGYIHYGDIHTKFSHFIDFSKSVIPKISLQQAHGYPFIKEGDLILVDASEDYSGVGKSVEIRNLGTRAVISGLHTFLLRSKDEKYMNGFKGYVHANPLVKGQFDRLATGLKVYGVSRSNLKKVFLPIPKPAEQTAIASVLSEMDAELEALEAKLAKYRATKAGMMQELLTGRIRLIEPKTAPPPTIIKETSAHSKAFNEAVLISVFANKFASEKYPLSRTRYTKLLYLFHRRKEKDVEGFRKMPGGPYNPDNRYKGPEDIAKKKKYVVAVSGVNKGMSYSGFLPGESFEEAMKYFYQWYDGESLNWLVSKFKTETRDNLELYTTVDKAACELVAESKPVTVENIKKVLVADKNWKNKFDKPLFSNDANIAKAIDYCSKLFGNW